MGGSKAFRDQLARRVESAQKEYDRRIEELTEKVRGHRRDLLERDLVKGDALMANLQKEREELADEIRQKTDEAYRLGRSSVDSEMLKSEIKCLEDVLHDLRFETARARIELNAPPRIAIFQRAEAPLEPDEGDTKPMN